MERGRVLIISDGGTAALLACAAASDRATVGSSTEGRGVAWVAPLDERAGEAMRAAAERQAELFGFSVVEGLSAATVAALGNATERQVLALYRAARTAAAAGIARVVWPQSVGADFRVDVATATVDRALLVSRLASLDAGDAATEIATPYADLTDAQIADLVLDMDLPIWLCWWWDGATPEAKAEQERWTEAMRKAGWKGPLPGPDVVTVRRGSERAAGR